jgi:hypothetical protein
MAWQNSIEREWDGATDGNWSTFELRVGTPPQSFFALVSTRRSWLRLPFAWNQTPCERDVFGEYAFECRDHSVRFGSFPAFEPCVSTSVQVLDKCTTFQDVFDDGNPERHEYILNSTQYSHMTGQMASADKFAPCEFPEDNIATIGLLPRVDYNNVNGKGLYPDHPFNFDRASFIQGFPAFQLNTTSPLKLIYGYTAGAWYRKSM